jgi:hypothetical protein
VLSAPEQVPLRVTLPTIRQAIETSLMWNTRDQLKEILPDDLGVIPPNSQPLDEYQSKGALIGAPFYQPYVRQRASGFGLSCITGD